ncbi:hypothetical protein [Dyella sp. RRB7]|uniref:hypothetical protein n=1 Tax=Dyella sp. RRB7 TaxID=2919502 RepID=UPI001FA97CCB|nr:hypothetical protein [Dyella sp. RRB7]
MPPDPGLLAWRPDFRRPVAEAQNGPDVGEAGVAARRSPVAYPSASSMTPSPPSNRPSASASMKRRKTTTVSIITLAAVLLYYREASAIQPTAFTSV